MPLTIIFARHGESQANIDGVFANRPGVANDLTPRGIAQAEAMAKSLLTHRISHVYTSPLSRAVQTAGIVAMRLGGVPLTETDALREYDVGDYEGLPYSGPDAWRWERYETVEHGWRAGRSETMHPGGESLADLEARLLPYMQGLIDHHDERDVVLAVSHGGFLRAVLPSLFANVSRDFSWAHTLGHADLVIGAFEHGTWHCHAWCGHDSGDEKQGQGRLA
jgi:broad specificity phosphatase PhoE